MVSGLSHAIGRLVEYLDTARDVFGDAAVKPVSNESNLAGHYQYSPERWRLFDGSKDTGERLEPEYNNVSEYNHAGDYHELRPDAGQTVIFESAERYRYVVSYEVEASFAAAINQELKGEDHVRLGFYDGTDGWFLEHNGSHAPDEVDMVSLRNGAEVYRRPATLYTEDMLGATRYALETAWYDVSRQQWTQSYGQDGDQLNKTLGKESLFGERGPSKGNLHLRFEVQADPDTTGLVFEAGSAALITKGGGGDVTRTKSKLFEATVGSSNTWVPILAYRRTPGQEVVNNQLLSFTIQSYSADTTIEGAFLAFYEDNVTFTGTDAWRTPDVWTEINNGVQVRTDVDTFPDSTGAAVTSTTDPGGWQIGYATLVPTTGKQLSKGAAASELGVKRNIPDNDIGVVLINAGSTGDVEHAETIEQDW